MAIPRISTFGNEHQPILSESRQGREHKHRGGMTLNTVSV